MRTIRASTLFFQNIRFIEEQRSTLAGLVITHAHEDHIGARDRPVAAARRARLRNTFTAGMLKAKLAEHGGRSEFLIHEIPLEGRFKAGPFDVEMVSVAHSIPESSALAIHTPLGTVIHTGDWKLDATPITGKPVDGARLTAFGDAGVLAIVGDSTNSMREAPRRPSAMSRRRSASW